MSKPPATLPAITSQLCEAVNVALAEYSQFDDDCPQVLRDAIQHCLLAPGKRLRPLLVLLSARACGCSIEAAMPAACAVEMIHAYSLIHDDLPAMDDDDLRRGRPTCHVVFGEANAILAGDALQARAFELLATGITPPEIAARCCAELAQAAGASQLVGGQVDDLASEGKTNEDGDGLAQLVAIHRRKTGALFLVSLRLGGIVGQASDEQLQALTAYGRHLGPAFQIVDDLLDVEGNDEDLGKKTGMDVQRGKLTYPALLGIEESNRQAQEHIDLACQAIEPFNALANDLQMLARYVLERKR